MLNDALHITVIGAGHGGKAMAADMAVRGFTVKLYNRTEAHIEAIQLRGGIELTTEDGRVHFGVLDAITSDIADAVKDANLIMVVIPACGHHDIALSLAPHLQNNQVVLLNPGRTGGALEFTAGIRAAGCTARPAICEAETFIFAARSMGPAQVRIFRTKFSVPVAALPTTRTKAALSVINKVYSQFIPAKSVLHTSMNNMGAIFHPALVLLNAGWIERTRGDFEFYMDGVTHATAKVLEALDRERVTVAAAVGIRAQTSLEWLSRAYHAVGDNLYEAMHANQGYSGIKAPPQLQHRYIFEDVPCSLVPIAEIGNQYGVETATVRTMVSLANIVHGKDYWREGRTLSRLDIENMSVPELHKYVETGER